MVASSASSTTLVGRELFPGAGSGPLLRLGAPLSFWGGVDPRSGRITQVRHPEVGRSVAGAVLALAEPIGSSSSSYVLLELISRGLAPAAIVLGAPDAILVVGCIVAREIGLAAPPVVVVEPVALASLGSGQAVVRAGTVAFEPAAS